MSRLSTTTMPLYVMDLDIHIGFSISKEPWSQFSEDTGKFVLTLNLNIKNP